MFETVMFDLDGTLTNPQEGITKSVQYALEKFGIKREQRDLLPFIGPPLTYSFRNFYGFSEEDAEKAAGFYRERYLVTGWKENFPYVGVEAMLKSLAKRGATLIVATSKPADISERVLETFGLRRYFSRLVGSEHNGAHGEKWEIVAKALRYAKGRAAMIGDRKYDIVGAKANGVFSVGVRYGFAEAGELEEAGADHIADSVEDLRDYLEKNCGSK